MKTEFSESPPPVGVGGENLGDKNRMKGGRRNGVAVAAHVFALTLIAQKKCRYLSDKSLHETFFIKYPLAMSHKLCYHISILNTIR